MWPHRCFLNFFFKHSRYDIIWGSNLRFELALYPNLNLPRGSGSGILLNLIPEPQVQNQVQTRFGRFGNRTVASLKLCGGFLAKKEGVWCDLSEKRCRLVDFQQKWKVCGVTSLPFFTRGFWAKKEVMWHDLLSAKNIRKCH